MGATPMLFKNMLIMVQVVSGLEAWCHAWEILIALKHSLGQFERWSIFLYTTQIIKDLSEVIYKAIVKDILSSETTGC